MEDYSEHWDEADAESLRRTESEADAIAEAKEVMETDIAELREECSELEAGNFEDRGARAAHLLGWAADEIERLQQLYRDARKAQMGWEIVDRFDYEVQDLQEFSLAEFRKQFNAVTEKRLAAKVKED